MNLEIGDTVKCVNPLGGALGREYTVTRVMDHLCEVEDNLQIVTNIPTAYFIVVRKAHQHPHRAIILEWLNGGTIEWRGDGGYRWNVVLTASECVRQDRSMPGFSPSLSYRVKPQKPAKELEVEKIESDMRTLADRV